MSIRFFLKIPFVLWFLFTSASVAQPSGAQFGVQANDLIITYYNPPTPTQIAQIAGVSGVVVTPLTQRSARVFITDTLNEPAIRGAIFSLSSAGQFSVEYNRPVQVALQITDPFTLWHMVASTGLGTHSADPRGGMLSAPTALDETLGAGVPIAVVDLNRDYYASYNSDMPAPAIDVVTNLVSSPVPPNIYHADQVASVIFAGVNNGIGTSGVCPGCIWHSYTAHTEIDPQLATTQPLLNQLLTFLELVRTSSAEVVNMSWGSVDYSSAIDSVVRGLFDAGKIVVAASGNSGFSNPLYPARLPYVVSVGSVQADPVSGAILAAGTNRGARLMAPGVQIVTPIVGPPELVPGFPVVYESRSGSSYAAPHVSGVFGLLLSLLRTDPARYPITTALSAVQRRDYLISLLERTALDLGAPGPDPVFGAGVVRADEAMRTMLADNSPSLSSDLQQGIIEWRSTSGTLASAGAPFIPMFSSEFRNSQPTTVGVVRRSARHGECYLPGSYKFLSPTFTATLTDTKFEIVGQSGADLDVRLSSNVGIKLRQKVAFAQPVPLQCLAGWDDRTFDVAWAGAQSNTRVINAKYRLGINGYERVGLIANGPAPTRTFQYSFPSSPTAPNAASQFSVFLDGLEPAIRLVEGALNGELEQMIDAMVRGSLTVDRSRVASYTQARTAGSADPEPALLPEYSGFENNPQFIHTSPGSQSRSDIGVRIGRSNSLPLVSPGPALAALGGVPLNVTSAGDSTIVTSENFLNAMLINLHSRGFFTSDYNSALEGGVQTTTESSLSKVALELTASAYLPPVASFTPQPGNIGNIRSAWVLGVVLRDAETSAVLFTGTVPLAYTVPLTDYDIYRPRGFEFDRSDSVTRFEQRFAIDFLGSSAVVEGYASEDEPLAPGVNLSVGELAEIFKQLFGPTVARTLAALSGVEIFGGKNLGSFGCILNLSQMVQEFGLSVNGLNDLAIRSSRGCYQLNFGNWLPRQRPVSSVLGSNSVRGIDYIPLRAVLSEPVATFVGSPVVQGDIHPLTVGTQTPVEAYALRSTTTAAAAEELQHSLDGVVLTNFSGATQEQVVFYEQIWQRRLYPRGVFLPERYNQSTPEYEMVTRPRERTYLPLGDHCLPKLRVRFSYMVGTPPTVYQEFVQSYLENSIYQSKDSWTPVPPAQCGGSGTSGGGN